MLARLLRSEARAITPQSLWLTDASWTNTLTGVRMDQSQALKLNAVYAAVRLIADTISTLPVDTFRRVDGERVSYRPRPLWVDQPDPDLAVQRSDWYQALLISLLLNGNFYGRILRDGTQVVAIAVLDPTTVEPRRNARGFVDFVVNGSTVVPAEDMVHITDLRKPGAVKGTSRVDELRETLSLGKALDDFASRYFGSGTLSGGVVYLPGDATQEQAERLKDQFEKNSRGMRNAHRPNVLTGGAKYERMASDAEQAQLLESRRYAVEEAARAFNIPPSKLGVTTPGTRAYASIEQDNIDFVTGTLRSYVYKIEEALSRLLPDGAFLRINMDGLLRGDLQSRYAAYAQGIQSGFLSINDIHRLEDMRPVEGGDVLRVPLANVNLDAANIVETEKRVNMVRNLVFMGFDPAESLAMIGLPQITHTGLPSVQLQGIAQVDPEDPTAVYPVEG